MVMVLVIWSWYGHVVMVWSCVGCCCGHSNVVAVAWVPRLTDLLFIFLYGTHPFAQTLCCCRGSPDLHRVKLRVVGVAAPDLGNNGRLDVVLQNTT